MPQPKSISPGKGREALRQKVQIYRLNMVRLNRTYYSLLKFTSKIFKNCLPQSNSSELRKFRAIRPHSLRIPQNSHYSINLLCIMFQAPSPPENPAEFQRIMQIPRNSPTQSANHAKFTPFANITPYVSDAWPVAKNSLKFQQIK